MMLRVALFGQTGPYAPIALMKLLEASGQHRSPQHHAPWEITCVIEGRRLPIGRANHRLFEPRPKPLPHCENLRDIAVAAGIPTLQTCDVNDRVVCKYLKNNAIDMIVCVGFDRLFSPELLATPKRGGINAHPSRLPEWRGPAPIFWMVKHGARSSAITLHALDAKEDHGPIYAQESFILPVRASGDDIYRVAGALAGRMLAQALDRAADNALVGIPQDDSRATRAPRPKPEDAFVEPSEWHCETLVNFASAAPFFRTPWMRLGDETFFIRRGLRAEPGRQMPAQYVQCASQLLVLCRDGVAHVEIQT